MGDADKADNKKVKWVLEDMFVYLQGGKDQEHGEVNLDDHIQEFSRKGGGHLADDDQHDGGQSCRQEGGEDGSAKNYFHDDGLVSHDGCGADFDILNIVLG